MAEDARFALPRMNKRAMLSIPFYAGIRLFSKREVVLARPTVESLAMRLSVGLRLLLCTGPRRQRCRASTSSRSGRGRGMSRTPGRSKLEYKHSR